MSNIESKPLSDGRISYIFILVRDLPRMLAFYRDRLGFEVTHAEEGACAFLALRGQGPHIALYAGRNTPPADESHWFLVVDVGDIEAARARLREAGVEVGPIDAVPHGRAATFPDPEGNLIELHQPA